MNTLLVHGLGRTPFSLFPLAATLRRAGHRTQFFGYSPTLESVASITARLAARLRVLARSDRPVALVGHSLGGLLLRLALPEVPGLRVRRLVMLGSPNQPPRLAARAWRFLPFRVLARDCGHFLATSGRHATLPPPAVPYSLIAGDAGPLGRFSPFGDDANDGVVSVSETRIHPADAPEVFPVWHSVMMNAPVVRRRIVTMLSEGDTSDAQR